MAKNEVIKHSAVVQIEHKVSLIQQQTWNVLFANAFYDLEKQDEFQIPILELLKYIPGATNREHLKRSLKKLVSTSVECNIFDKDMKNNWTCFALLSGVDFKNEICFYRYDKSLKELLNNPSIYSKISLLIQRQYKGGRYGWFLYELCFDYKDIGKTPKISTLDLKKFFGVDGKSYSQFKEFNKWVIKPAVKEINNQTDLTLKTEFYRTGRKVSHIQFFITQKKDFQPALPPSESNQEEVQKLSENQRGVLKRLEVLGVSSQYAGQVLEESPLESVETAVEALEEIEKNKGLNYPNNALKAALKDAWKSKKRRRMAVRDEEAGKEKERFEEIEAQKNIEEGLKERRQKEENERFAALSDDEKFGLLLTGFYRTRFEELDVQGREDFEKEVYDKILFEHADDLRKAVDAARDALIKAEEEREAREEAEKIRMKKEERERKERDIREYESMSDEDKFSRIMETLDRESARICRELSEEDGKLLKEEAFKVVFTESGGFQTALPLFQALVQKIKQDRDREEGMAKIRKILQNKSRNA